MSKIGKNNDFQPYYDGNNNSSQKPAQQGSNKNLPLFDFSKSGNKKTNFLNTPALPEIESDFAGTPNSIAPSGEMTDNYLREHNYVPLTNAPVRFNLGFGDDKDKYVVDIQAFYNSESTSSPYRYRVVVYQNKNGKYQGISPEDDIAFNSFLLSNYGFDYQQLQVGGHIDYDKATKQYVLRGMTPLQSTPGIPGVSGANGVGFENNEDEPQERTNRRFAIALIRSMYCLMLHTGMKQEKKLLRKELIYQELKIFIFPALQD